MTNDHRSEFDKFAEWANSLQWRNQKSDCWRHTHVTTFGGLGRTSLLLPPRPENPVYASGLSVGHVHEPCKNGWTDRDVVWGADSRGSKNHELYRGRVEIPHTMGKFGGCPVLYGPLKIIVSLLRVYAVPRII